MDDVSDLLGSVGGDPSSGASPEHEAAVAGVNAASNMPDDEVSDAELALVQKTWKEYSAACEFDKGARLQYARDRKYAAGLANPDWASDANLIGSFIDILVSFLYAQNPDPGVRPAKQVGEQPDHNATMFAETMELVIEQLWSEGDRLKKSGKKAVRSALTVGAGWLKATMLTQKVPAPQLEQQLLTLQDQVAAIHAAQREIAEGTDVGDPSTDMDVQLMELHNKIEGAQAKLVKKQRYGLMVDQCRAEDMQVALNISDLADYKDADWIASAIYVPKDTLTTRFPDLDEDDLNQAETYYQNNPPTPGAAEQAQLGDRGEEAQFSKTAPQTQASMSGGGSGKPLEFAKIVELWDRRDLDIKTMIAGVKCWAVQPYSPPQASSRFYPFFYVAFFPVDGKRHPQSLPWRLRKLQDEYASCRSNQRLTRERSITGVIFNAAAIDPEDANKIKDANQQELIAVRSVADSPLQNAFIAKPVGTYNPQLYDTAAIRADMEAISGVQEALQQNASGQGVQPKTATEAQIQQQGFMSRTGADRDVLEDMLTDLAHYTAEVSTQECSVQWVQRVCGQQAFWLGPNPQTGQPGMDVEDVLTMVEVSIDAGTTGKPNFAADKAAWAQILPLLENSLKQIRMEQLLDPELAQSYIHVLGETLKRMDDRLDLDDFIPTGAPPPPPPPPAPPPQTRVTIQLMGQLPPQDVAAVMQSEQIEHPATPPPGMMPHPPIPGAPPGAPPGTSLPPAMPMPPGLAPHIPQMVPGTQVPMPPLHVKTPPVHKPAAPPSKK
jgi:hypothetical protein